MNTECPHCQTRVNLTADGKCPLCRRAIGAAGEDAAEESSIEATREQARAGAAIEATLCPMCGAAVQLGDASCANCGEDFGTATGNIWQYGKKTLIMHKTAELPNRCVKSNQPSSRRMKRSLSWHHPAWYVLVVVCGLIPYVIVALIVRKTATIYVGLSEDWFARRRRAIVIASGISLVGLALVVGGFYILKTAEDIAGVMLGFGFLLLLSGMVYGLVRARIVGVKKIKNDYIWLNGCHADFLDHFPEWTGEAR